MQLLLLLLLTLAISLPIGPVRIVCIAGLQAAAGQSLVVYNHLDV
jgi:hypothetical protein